MAKSDVRNLGNQAGRTSNTHHRDMHTPNRSTRLLLCLLVLACAGEVRAGVIFSDDFDPITSTQWTLRGAAATGLGVQGFDSGNALHFSGDTRRAAVTTFLDLTAGGTVAFDFRGGNEDIDGDTWWEDVDAGEDAILEYSTTAGPSGFVQLATLDLAQFLDDTPTTTWLSMNVTVPVAAQTTTTRFRWRQPTWSGLGYDHWAIDNVVITANPEPSTMILIGTAGICGAWTRRRRRRHDDESEDESSQA